MTDHEAWGLGGCCVFRNDGLTADRAIEAPELPGVKIQRMVTIHLSGGKDRTGIKHIINDRGDAVIGKMRSVLDQEKSLFNRKDAGDRQAGSIPF